VKFISTIKESSGLVSHLRILNPTSEAEAHCGFLMEIMYVLLVEIEFSFILRVFPFLPDSFIWLARPR
jgi:hypothetical protein